jgi:hypothetical protein
MGPHRAMATRNAARSAVQEAKPRGWLESEHVEAIVDILGHTALATARKYYIQANSLSANREYQRRIQMLRSNYSRIAHKEAGIDEFDLLRADDFDESESHAHR